MQMDLFVSNLAVAIDCSQMRVGVMKASIPNNTNLEKLKAIKYYRPHIIPFIFFILHLHALTFYCKEIKANIFKFYAYILKIVLNNH